MEPHNRGRGRPAGSVKPTTQRRQRKDYRFSPETLRQIEQGRLLADTTETAFVEEAILHYVSLLNGQADRRELEQPRPHLQPPRERTQADAYREQRPPQRQVARKQISSPPVEAPVPSASSRHPSYQIYLKHEPGPCPRLPEGEFAYIDLHTSIEPRQCPTHRVFARPCSIAVARQRVEQLKREGVGITHIWLDKSGTPLPKDSWHQEQGRWVRND